MAKIYKYKTEQGQPRYRVRYDYYKNGERKQRTQTFKKSSDANAFMAKVEHSINTGMYADARGFTVGQYLDLWLDTYAVSVRANTRKNYAVCINRHIKPHIGGTRLESLSTLAIQHMYGEILKTEYAPAKYEKHGALSICAKPAKTYSVKTVRNINAPAASCPRSSPARGAYTEEPRR